MLKINKLPHILFIIGAILVGFYGLALSILALFMQILFILKFWKNKPKQKQRNKFTLGCSALFISLILFSIGLYQFNSYFGGFELIMWLIIGAVPFVISSLLLLTIPTDQKNHK